ncbi:NAD-dependent epimerase/dehydratase family protein [Microterricola pindariensis]|uniref:UDP-glucose 4-epimerase n=1 Tax=Microterricola pindariensis TaxID=478010 RepID=A0ABX5ASV0_9MICO|nr:NAD-dependent epimerase/dehydratase family protein [Microterricola pindariensis]PPL15764.1 UDP-glucose 4-epimerase [Microterricola pindariensis]
MRVVVTGAAGFIGSRLCRQLLADPSNEVLGVDMLTDYYDVNLKRQNLSRIPTSNFTFLEGDLNRLELEDVLDGVDAVIHLAGQPGVRKSWGDEFGVYVAQNIEATQRLLEAARTSSTIRSFVYASSSSVYGDAERYPTKESDRPQPISPYGVSKLAAEHLCSLYASEFDVPTVSLRFFTVYGPGQRPDMAFNRFIRAGLERSPLTVHGDGTQIREFTHVDDIVRALISAANAGLPAGTVMNLSGGSSVSVNDVIATLSDLLGHSLEVSYGAPVAGDVFQTGGDTTLARELLGWEPTIGIREGLATEIDWLREHR